ncbi:hypothetical protein BCR34DRAFT_460509, partial [Clohesyomyces aquaticus]
RLLAQRSVHIRIQPRPANLSESREIFRVLQRFGEISTYKSLRYEYHNPAANSALAIYRDAVSAQKALDASPIRFSLEKVLTDDETSRTVGAQWTGDAIEDEEAATPPVKQGEIRDDGTGIEDILRPTPLLNRPLDSSSSASSKDTPSPPPPQRMPFEAPSPQETSTKWFQLTVDRSRVVHQDYVERQPYWAKFSPMKSMAQEDLAKVVPLIGLSDVSKRPVEQHRTPNHVLRKMAMYVEHHMPTVRQMYEEGGR